MKMLLAMFLTFAKIGVMTFGGGYSMIPIIEREIVNKRKWATFEELMNYFAVAQCTPGVIAVNTATFIGYKYKGVPGAICATLGVVFPSIIIITIVSAFLQSFIHIELVSKAFLGIRAVVCSLILSAVVKFFRTGVKDITGVLIAIASFIAAAVFGFTSVHIVIGVLILSSVIYLIRRRKGE